MARSVVFTPQAEEQILALYRYIAEAASADIALNYTEALIRCCERLAAFPSRGLQREDIRPGLRITNYKSRTAIAFAIQPDRVEILGIYHGGRNYALHLQEPEAAD